MLFKKIKVQNYEIQTRVFHVLFFALIGIWIAISVMFFVNRYTYSKKSIDIKYLNSNLSRNSIKAIIPARSVINGDNFIIENYLAQYVKIRESIIPKDFITKDRYVMAFSSPSVYGIYAQSNQRTRKLLPSLLRYVEIDRILQLDDTLYQIHYHVLEKKDYRKPQEIHKRMIATLRYAIVEIGEYDQRSNIPKFDLINPLKIELSVYTTAQRFS